MPKIVDHEERRASIALAAAEVIAKVGIEGVTMKRIATQADVTTGAVMHYFADKDEVVLEALLAVDASMTSRYEKAMAGGGSRTDLLLATLPHDDESHRDWAVWRVFADYAARSDVLLRQYRETTDSWLEAAIDAVAERTNRSRDEARVDAEVIVATVDAIGDAASVDPVRWPVDRQRRVLENVLMQFGGL